MRIFFISLIFISFLSLSACRQSPEYEIPEGFIPPTDGPAVDLSPENGPNDLQ